MDSSSIGLNILFYLSLALGAIYFFYFGVITLLIRKDTRNIYYYRRLPEEEKKQIDASRLIRINSILALCLSPLAACIFIITTFNISPLFTPITITLYGLLMLIGIIYCSKIPLKLSKKK